MFVNEAGAWSQWGGTREEMAERVQYVDAMAEALAANTDYYQQAERAVE